METAPAVDILCETIFFFLSEDIKHIQLPKPLPSSLAEHSSALSHITAMSARPRPPAPPEPLGTEPRGAATAQNYPECSASRESHGWQLEHPPRPLGRRFARSPRHSPTTHTSAAQLSPDLSWTRLICDKRRLFTSHGRSPGAREQPGILYSENEALLWLWLHNGPASRARLPRPLRCHRHQCGSN